MEEGRRRAFLVLFFCFFLSRWTGVFSARVTLYSFACFQQFLIDIYLFISLCDFPDYAVCVCVSDGGLYMYRSRGNSDRRRRKKKRDAFLCVCVCVSPSFDCAFVCEMFTGIKEIKNNSTGVMLGAALFCFHSVFLIGRWTTMPIICIYLIGGRPRPRPDSPPSRYDGESGDLSYLVYF